VANDCAVNRRSPLDLSTRLAVCDANYWRLLKLLPEFSEGTSRTVLLPAVSQQTMEASHSLKFTVTEAFRYTSTVSLLLRVEEDIPSWYLAPHLTVRLYHDAGMAEVISYQDQSCFKAVYSEDDAPRFTRDEKMQINQFLAELLTLCLEGGMSYLTLPACLRTMKVSAAPLSPEL
jgi:uncharacterized protein YqiB (DUF1249 family)